MKVIHLIARCSNINGDTLIKFFDSKTGNKDWEVRMKYLPDSWYQLEVDSFTIYPHNYIHISYR